MCEQVHGDGGSTAGAVGRGGVSVVGGGDRGDDGQAESRAAVVPGAGAIGSLESFECARQELRGKSRPGVGFGFVAELIGDRPGLAG